MGFPSKTWKEMTTEHVIQEGSNKFYGPLFHLLSSPSGFVLNLIISKI